MLLLGLQKTVDATDFLLLLPYVYDDDMTNKSQLTSTMSSKG